MPLESPKISVTLNRRASPGNESHQKFIVNINSQMDAASQNDFNELSFYTLAHPDMAYFIHQHIVDACQAQNASEKSKSIGVVFSLVGLYLYLERNHTGRQVQLAHMRLAKRKKNGLPFNYRRNVVKLRYQRF